MSSSTHRHIIGIVGPVGAGKTTLAEGLATHFKFKIHREEPTQNPYLATFYQELQAGGVSPMALKSQLFFLLAAQVQAQKILKEKGDVVWDVPIFGHRMYADLLHKQKAMPEADYQLYCHVYDLCLLTIPMPDVLLVATTDHKTLVSRINQRGRAAELGTPASYWNSQIKYWENRVREVQLNEIPLLKIDSGRVDWTNKDGVTQIWELTKNILH